MKKYFMKGTDDELKFGDVIELDLVGDEKGVIKHTHLECKFIPELVDELLKEDIIEVKTTEEKPKKAGVWTFKKDYEKKDLIDFGSDDSLAKQVAELEDRVTELEGTVADLMAELEEDE